MKYARDVGLRVLAIVRFVVSDFIVGDVEALVHVPVGGDADVDDNCFSSENININISHELHVGYSAEINLPKTQLLHEKHYGRHKVCDKCGRLVVKSMIGIVTLKLLCPQVNFR